MDRSEPAALTQITVSQCLRQAVERLPAEDGRHVAECLLAHVLRRDRAWLFAHAHDALELPSLARFQALLERRTAGEPVAYLTGTRGFWTLDLAVTPHTLIPRPETERLVELALQRIPLDQRWEVADLGTGSGAIALALASERTQARVVATDISAAALAVAQRNAHAHGIDNVRFVQGHWWQPLRGQRFDLVVSNPPYIAEGDPHLQQGDLRYEPMSALASGQDGLAAIDHIIGDAPAHLRAGGWLLLEHGWQQAAAVRDRLACAGFSAIASEQDLERRERVTLGCWPG